MVNQSNLEQVARPTTIDELRVTLRDWIARTGTPGKKAAAKLLTWKPGQALLVEVKLSGNPSAEFDIQTDRLACRIGKHRLAVYLDSFHVRTELRNNQAVLELTPRESSTFPPLEQTFESIRDSKHRVFLTRALKAVTGLDRTLPKKELDEATAEPNDYLVLQRALSSPIAIGEAAEADLLAAARLRGMDRQRNLLQAGGGSYSAEQAAQVLGISRQAVDKRRREGKLIGLTQGRRGYAYPAWQFDNGAALPHLGETLSVLAGHDPWMQMAFFLNKNSRLFGRTPLETLKQGDVEAVRRAAESYGEQEAS